MKIDFYARKMPRTGQNPTKQRILKYILNIFLVKHVSGLNQEEHHKSENRSVFLTKRLRAS